MKPVKPHLQVTLSYQTASSLCEVMTAAYMGLETRNPELYKEVMAQTKPFYEFLVSYLDR